MTASPKPPQGGRVHLGAPIVPMNRSGRYLRHRVAAERAYAARRRAIWWYRGAAAVLLCLFYLTIGRDLVALARAKTGTAKMEIRSEVHQLTTDLDGVAGAASPATREDGVPLALTSAAGLADAEGPP
ncbi:MAG: hypothetical protein MUQ65_15220 [Armatimonadetes bacterium]|nr:hypothetical protein [Armatimonadota bacterium]